MKKKASLIGLLFSLLVINIPMVLATDLLNRVFSRIISIGNLSFLGISDASLVVGFTRILVGILVFAIFFALLKNLGAVDFLKKQAAMVAGILAIISAVFMPASVLLGIGAGWGTAVALILVGGPIVGLAYLLYLIPGKDNETKFTVFIKIMLCLILFWILSAMKYHIGRVV